MFMTSSIDLTPCEMHASSRRMTRDMAHDVRCITRDMAHDVWCITRDMAHDVGCITRDMAHDVQCIMRDMTRVNMTRGVVCVNVMHGACEQIE